MKTEYIIALLIILAGLIAAAVVAISDSDDRA
jgi:hypothetical protein